MSVSSANKPGAGPAARQPEFPPLITGHGVGEGVDAFAHAVAGARDGRYGAGDFVWSRSPVAFAAALVLEPDVPRARTYEMAFVAQVAFAECFGAIAPPEVALTFGWPATLRLNGARIGELQFALSPVDDADGAPDWLVVGLDLVLRHERYHVDPGEMPDVTTFEEEGCGDIEPLELVESFARHLLVWIHTWQDDGFRPVHDNYVFRADGYNEETEIAHAGKSHFGVFLGLDETGAALLRSADGEVVALDAAQAFAGDGA
ncbi:MAG: biotin/lipoate--protein ligase family protein [Rhodobiaceae bacterium]|nr:biotin/lipoate--protein ligase family protein [Rhodobiaceae bacterium]MCC0041043.1 biotin/lipoate--protein ligase family protein [Rhodobiaceae bacterium]MCC0053934.1 biotin/lipoate--protein ligase family protein [Rhodobiaceae bacterium]